MVNAQDVYILAYLAGHADFATTKRYIHAQEDTVRAAMERAHGEKGGHSFGHSGEQLPEGPPTPTALSVK